MSIINRNILLIAILSFIVSSSIVLVYHFTFVVAFQKLTSLKFEERQIVEYCLGESFYNNSRNVTDLTNCIKNLNNEALRNLK